MGELRAKLAGIFVVAALLCAMFVLAPRFTPTYPRIGRLLPHAETATSTGLLILIVLAIRDWRQKKRSKAHAAPGAGVQNAQAVPLPVFSAAKLPPQSVILVVYLGSGNEENFDFRQESIFPKHIPIKETSDPLRLRWIVGDDQGKEWPQGISALEVGCVAGNPGMKIRLLTQVFAVSPKRRFVSQLFTGRVPFQTKLRSVVLVIPLRSAGQATTQFKEGLRLSLEEFLQSLDCVAPLYVVFTECSGSGGIEGFTEYYDGVHPNEPGVWGVGIDSHEHSAGQIDRLQEGLAILATRLAEHRLSLLDNLDSRAELSEVKLTEAKARVYNFPFLFHQGVGKIRVFLEDIVKGKLPVIRLRGVHFVDRTAKHPDGALRPYVEDVLLKDQLCAKAKSSKPWAWSLVFGAVFLLLLFAFFFVLRSWLANRQINDQVARAREAVVRLEPSAIKLERLKALKQRLQEGDFKWRLGLLGFYQGDQLIDRVDRDYHEVFESYILQPVIHDLTNTLKNAPTGTLSATGSVMAKAREANAVSLQLSDANLRDALLLNNTIYGFSDCLTGAVSEEFIAKNLEIRWSNLHAERIAEVIRLQPHLRQFSTELLKSGRGALVAHEEAKRASAVAASYLSKASQVEGAGKSGLAGFVDEYNEANRPFAVEEILPEGEQRKKLRSRYDRLTTAPRTVPAAFVRVNISAIETLVAQKGAADGQSACLFAGDRAGASVKGMPAEYRKAYVEFWKKFLDDFKTTVSTTNATLAANQLEELADSPSPILGSLALVADNTGIAPISGATTNPNSFLAQVIPKFEPVRAASGIWPTPTTTPYLEALRRLALAVRRFSLQPDQQAVYADAISEADKVKQEVAKIKDLAHFRRDPEGVGDKIENILLDPAARARMAMRMPVPPGPQPIQ